MRNIKIKGEEAFIKLFNKTFSEIPNFREEFETFKAGIEEKRDWVDERSDKWHQVEENDLFNAHLIEVEQFVDTLESLLNEIEELEYPLDNE